MQGLKEEILGLFSTDLIKQMRNSACGDRGTNVADGGDGLFSKKNWIRDG